MKLTNDDIALLKEWGYKNQDIDQIEVASSLTRYEYKNKLISDAKALELLGLEQYLSGISRSAFHWSAVRETPKGEVVYFDSSALFK